MKLARASAQILLFALVLCVALCSQAGELFAGMGRAELPRPSDGPLGGYGGWRDRRAQDVLDPPEARALVLEQDGRRVALVSLDIVIVRPNLRDRLLQIASTFELDALILTATHTHSGPGGYIPGRVPARLTSGSFNPATLRSLVTAALRAVELALRDLAPARVGSGVAEIPLARNRRTRDGPRETDLPILRFEFPSGRAPIVLIAYGAHPTVLSPKSRAYSADYVGAARAWLTEHGWRSLFLPGPLGDQEPVSQLGPLWPRDLAKQHAQVDEIGTVLGKAVLWHARRLEPTSGAQLSILERWVDAPGTPKLRRFCTVWWLGPFLRGSIRSFFSQRVPIHALRIGDVNFLALPAEPSSAIGQQIRDAVDTGHPTFVVAHANDWLGYVLTPDAYRDGGYEACLSFYGADFGPWLVEEAVSTLRLLDSRAPAMRRNAR